MDTKKPIALLTEGIHPQAENSLRELDFQIKRISQAPEPKELIKHLKGVRALCSRSRTQISKDVLLSSQLDCLGAFCIGVNQIDLETASRQGIPVFNAPYGNTRSVAELTIGFIIALSRSLYERSKNMHEGLWKKSAKGCFELRGKTLGIVGYGNIGSQVSVLAESLGMRVLYYDIVNKLPMGNAKACFSLKSLLKESDFVSLHVPETPQTKNLIGPKEIGFMKKSSRLINTSRGSVANLSALKEALDSRHLSGAAIDVFPQEPKASEGSFAAPFQNRDNVILTPHIGGSTEEAQVSIVFEVSKSLKDFFQTGAVQNSVNFPSLSAPPPPEGASRISNVHKNRPGALSQINKLVSESGVNIKSQYLATNEWIGYLIMDLEKEDASDLSEKMSQLDLSIKTRLVSSPRALSGGERAKRQAPF